MNKFVKRKPVMPEDSASPKRTKLPEDSTTAAVVVVAAAAPVVAVVVVAATETATESEPATPAIAPLVSPKATSDDKGKTVARSDISLAKSSFKHSNFSAWKERFQWLSGGEDGLVCNMCATAGKTNAFTGTGSMCFQAGKCAGHEHTKDHVDVVAVAAKNTQDDTDKQLTAIEAHPDEGRLDS